MTTIPGLSGGRRGVVRTGGGGGGGLRFGGGGGLGCGPNGCGLATCGGGGGGLLRTNVGGGRLKKYTKLEHEAFFFGMDPGFFFAQLHFNNWTVFFHI